MPKLLWVALPLLAAAALLAVQMLRGRRPSRHALNVASSMLLLVYLLATAGLGIFWVANQQLPVFDWHYLFGYGTVLLVALHLVFNFRVVWRFFVRRAPRAATPGPERSAAPPQRSRRGTLAMLGATLAAGLAYSLGLQRGRRERVGPAAESPVSVDATAAADAAAMGGIEHFHALTSHSRAGVLTRAPVVDWGAAPAPFKQQASAPVIRLPAPGNRRTTPLDLGALADVLWHTTGVTETRGGLILRASPSSGALFSTELYVAVRTLPGLAPGVWHHDPELHALAPVGAAGAAAELLGAVFDDASREAPVLVVATAVFRRTGRKYGDRTYRYVLADLGHALENLRVAAGALGASMRLVAAFDEARVAQALGVDESDEGVLAIAALGAPALPAGTPVAGAPPLRAPSRGNNASDLGITGAMHAATSLRMATAARAAASAPVHIEGSAPVAAVALPRASPLSPDWLTVIARRRSVRRFAATALPLPMLAGVLAGLEGAAPMLSRAVHVNLVVNHVLDLAPGAYRYDAERHALAPRRTPMALRAAAGAAGLDQDVVTGAHVVFVLSIDRAGFAADPLGAARGYRHAFLEAGLVGERVYLEAGARGLGACGVGAFYDDEAAALVGLDPAQEWVVHFAALGVKA
jgi:SagB-type dehydrogenase family enzyme